MSQDTLRLSINSFLKHRVDLKNSPRASRNNVSNKVYMSLLAKRLILRLSNIKLLRFFVMAIIFVILILKNTDSLYYFSLNVFQPISVPKMDSFYNGGLDQCGLFEQRSNGEVAYSIEHLVNMDPSYQIVTYTNTNRKPGKKNSVLVGSVLSEEEATIDGFKTLFSRINKIELDKDAMTLAILFQKTSSFDDTIHSFIANYFELGSADSFGKIVVIYNYEPDQQKRPKEVKTNQLEARISSYKNFLINSALTTEKFILLFTQPMTLNHNAINRAKPELLSPVKRNSNRIFIGFETKDKSTLFQFVFMRSVIFKQGIQFSNILLGGNSWDKAQYVSGHQVEIQNLCYQAEAIGLQCDFIDV